MKKIYIILSLLLLNACSSQYPEHPILIVATPLSVNEPIGHWKMGDFTMGFAIETSEYFFITDGQGLQGQEGMSIGGPGMVDSMAVDSFRPVAKLSREIIKNETISFFGDLLLDDGQPYLHKGKKVVKLYHAQYKDQQFVIKRQ